VRIKESRNQREGKLFVQGGRRLRPGDRAGNRRLRIFHRRMRKVLAMFDKAYPWSDEPMNFEGAHSAEGGSDGL
jgi:hypothetical protein